MTLLRKYKVTKGQVWNVERMCHRWTLWRVQQLTDILLREKIGHWHQEFIQSPRVLLPKKSKFKHFNTVFLGLILRRIALQWHDMIIIIVVLPFSSYISVILRYFSTVAYLLGNLPAPHMQRCSHPMFCSIFDTDFYQICCIEFPVISCTRRHLP